VVKLSDELKKMFEEIRGTPAVAFVATVDAEGKPNVTSKGTLGVLDDENLWYVESVGKKTYENIKKNPNVAVAIANRQKLDGYQIKGKAEIVTEGSLYERAVKVTEELSRRLGRTFRKPISAVRIKVDGVYSIQPGPRAGEKIA
jgi:predicted pyridoxine 5'-phosphate oxidase superfamily flavin-nucleotide-binding protein